MKKIRRFLREHFDHCNKALARGGTISVGALSGAAFLETGWSWPVSLCVGFIAGILAIQLAWCIVWGLLRLFSFLTGIRIKKEWAKGLFFYCTVVVVFMMALGVHSKGEEAQIRLILVSLGAAAVWQAVFVSMRALKERQRVCSFEMVVFLVSIAGMGMLLKILTGEGIYTGNLDTYRSLAEQVEEAEQEKEAVSAFSESIKKGSAQVGTIFYGTNEASSLSSDTFDVTPYINGYEGIRKKLRDEALSYTLDQVPLSGVIYYPKGAKDCPVLFLVHGQHSMLVDSYLGYEYLGNYLASWGYVVVSVDENSLNAGLLEAVSNENDARALLLLENIRQVLQYGRQEDNPLYHTMDETKIALAGHSRGGETVAAATLLNQYSCYPGNGQIRLNYGFSIQSLLAIAPTSDQYEPAGHSVALEDINYLVLQGANDEDVTDFLGKETYDRVTFTGQKDCFKSSLYIAGANHGQFNTLWGKYDQPWPLRMGLNTTDLMSGKEQEILLMICAKTYLDCTLKEERTYQSLFYDWAAYKEYLPETLYLENYCDSTAQVLCDFEEDSDLTTGTDESVWISTAGMRIWNERRLYYSEEDPDQDRDTHVLYLSCVAKYQEPKLNLSLEKEIPAKGILQMEVCAPKGISQMSVVFQDGEGNKETVKVEDSQYMGGAIPTVLTKLEAAFQKEEQKLEMQTLRVPVPETLNSVSQISLVFGSGTKEVYLDHIALSEELENK